MTFLPHPPLAFGLTQLPMLWWLAAAAAPLLIHLLNRRPYREVPWAAVEYLMAALKKSSRRLRAENWILLAIRTAIVVLVVVAVAGPYIEQLGGKFLLGEPVHKIIVIDGSYSMGYKPQEMSRFEIAKQLARDIVGRSSQGDGFTLVLMGDPARVVVGTPAFVSDEVRDALARVANAASGDVADAQRRIDEDDFLKEIRDLKLPHGGGNLADALDRVGEIIRGARHEYPRLSSTEVYFLTDLGRTTWDLSALAAGKQIREQLAQLAGSARLAVADLGQEHCENLAVTALRSNRPIYTTHSPIDFQAEVQNFGDHPHSAHLELLVDGQRYQERTIDLAAKSQQSVAFAHRFEAPGDHDIEVRLSTDASDRLDIDNHRWLAAPVKESLSALIVNGEGSRDQARYLYNALDPYRDGSAGLPVRVEQVPDGGLLETDLRRFDCMFLSNVGQFTAAEARTLSDYVKGGGGLVFFLGDRVDPARYNQELGGGNGAPRLLPVQLDRPAEAGQYGFDPLDYKNPIVHEFQGNEHAGLLNTAIVKYFRLKPLAAAKATAQTALAIRETGDPAIIEERLPGSGPLGRGGESIVVAIPASFASIDPESKEAWSNWPIKNSFQPLVQSLLLAAVGPQGADRNTLVGRPLESSLPAAQAASSFTLQTPDGRKEQIRIASRDEANRWSFPNTWQSGIYRAEFPTAADNRLFAVNVNTAESDLSKIEPGELPAEMVVVPALTGHDDRPAAALGARSGQERWFLYTVLGLLLLETFLAWWFGWRAA